MTALTVYFPLIVMIALSITSCGKPNHIHPVENLDVDLDGDFWEWASIGPAFNDRRGDNRSQGIDFGELRIAQGENGIFLHIEVGRETILQNSSREEAGNDLRLYLDHDSSSATGFKSGDLGVDLEIRFGSKKAFLYNALTGNEIGLNELGLIAAPTHSSSEFEIFLPYESLGLPSPQKVIKLYLEEKGGKDRLPDSGHLTLTLNDKPEFKRTPAAIPREGLVHFRVLSHNVLRTGPVRDPNKFRRYLRAIQPDIINFQEIRDWTREQATRFIAETLGGEWYSSQVSDCVTISRWPIRKRAAIDDNLLSLIDLPESITGSDLLIFNAHTPCCDNNPGRDWEHDHMSATWRDLKLGKGPFEIQDMTPFIILGDLNMVGYRRQLESLRSGDLFDNETFGPDFGPDWNSKPLTSAPLRHSHTNSFYSWRNDRDRYTPGKLDFILFTESVLKLVKSYTLFTPEIPDGDLKRWRLEPDDSLVSDHLVLVADFAIQ